MVWNILRWIVGQIPGFMVGGLFGVMIMAILICGGRDDDMRERARNVDESNDGGEL